MLMNYQQYAQKTTWNMIEQQVFQGNLTYADGRYVGEIPIERDPNAKLAVVTSGGTAAPLERNEVKFHRELVDHQCRAERDEILALEVSTILWEAWCARRRGEDMPLPPVVCFAFKNDPVPTFLVYRGASTYVAALKMSKAYNYQPVKVPIEVYVVSKKSEIDEMKDRVGRYYDHIDMMF